MLERILPYRSVTAALSLAVLLATLAVAGSRGAETAPIVAPPPPAATATGVTAVVATGTAAPVDKTWEMPRPGAMETIIARIVVKMMPLHHYEHLQPDDALSERLFQAYFDHLDPEHSFFLASDLTEFASFKPGLCDLLQLGKPDFAYRVYERMVQRVRERVEFVRAEVKKPMDFTTDETLLIDRSKAPWCKDRAELDALWALRVKNQMLSYILQDKAATIERDKKEKASVTPDAAGKTNAKTEPPPVPQKPPAERVVRFYERYLTTLQENESMDVLEQYLNSFSMLYDPHSNYMAPASEEDFNISMKLSLQGIGAVLTSDDGYTKIVEIIVGGPASQDGRLQEGDRITAVAQEGKEAIDAINMPLNKVVRMIRGAKGTRVTLTVLPAEKGLSGLPVNITLTRDEVKLTEQEAKCEYKDLPPSRAAAPAPGKAAIIDLPSFYADFDGRSHGDKEYKSSSRDVRRLLEAAEKEHVAGVILDLRSDGGGSLDEAVSIAGLFIPPGPVVQVRNAERGIQLLECKDAALYTGPLVVLVNRLSASASEIVAAALQDYRRAVIVGEQSTHGKGTVQTVYHLDDIVRRVLVYKNRPPGSLKFTIAKFYRVNGGSTQLKGVVPDVTFPSFTDFMELGETKLPSALGWDEIEARPIHPGTDISLWLPTLKEWSQARTAADPEFQAYAAVVKRYGEFRQIKSISLNRAKREALQKEEEEFSKTIQASLTNSRKARGKDKDKEKDTPPPKDLMLDEALHILGDMIRLKTEPPPLIANPIAAAAAAATADPAAPSPGTATAK